MATNLISISGRIGSGKDTVGRIIQMLIANKTSNVCKQNPFTTDEFSVTDIDVELTHHSDWQIRKFAGKLKQIASLLTDIPVERFEDQEFKKTFLGEEWNNMQVRVFLQKLGTEAMRDGLHTNTWINAAFADYCQGGGRVNYGITDDGKRIPVSYDSYGKQSNWIFTDTRFGNEFKAIKDRGGITIRVTREGTKQENEHPSETALDSYQFDYEIQNNGTLEELTEKVKQILIAENIL